LLATIKTKGQLSLPLSYYGHGLKGVEVRIFRDLAFPQFVERLAVDAERRGGTCFEALQTDLDAARIAIAILARVDTADRLFDFLDELALAVAIAQLERHVRLLARTVVRVREDRRLVLHRMHGAVDVLGELVLHLLQHLLEVGELPRVHVFLLAFRLVRRN